jgi:hypothetical protein
MLKKLAMLQDEVEGDNPDGGGAAPEPEVKPEPEVAADPEVTQPVPEPEPEAGPAVDDIAEAAAAGKHVVALVAGTPVQLKDKHHLAELITARGEANVVVQR